MKPLYDIVRTGGSYCKFLRRWNDNNFQLRPLQGAGSTRSRPRRNSGVPEALQGCCDAMLQAACAESYGGESSVLAGKIFIVPSPEEFAIRQVQTAVQYEPAVFFLPVECRYFPLSCTHSCIRTALGNALRVLLRINTRTDTPTALRRYAPHIFVSCVAPESQRFPLVVTPVSRSTAMGAA